MHPCRVKSLTQLFRVGIAHPLGERSTNLCPSVICMHPSFSIYSQHRVDLTSDGNICASLPSMADQLLSTVTDYHSLPENYVRPEDQRPRLAEVVSDAHIPIIDMSAPDKSHVVSQIGHACRSYGFFQVSSHTHTAQDSTVFRLGSALYVYWLMFVYRC
ncbi:hypothetical protein GW17_00025152 [Ensete ventricosum]|nr:hypothetical protein GW17_00025152 [Ensete ventricosum]